METISRNDVKRLFPRRARQSHKGYYGRLLIVAGSSGMAGAAVLCARAALRSGAGLLRLSIDEALFPVLHIGVPEATCVGRHPAVFAPAAMESYDAIAVGPGLSVSEKTGKTLSHIIKEYGGKLILDADALNLVATLQLDLAASPADILLTPHPGEAARLLQSNTAAIGEDRAGAATELARRFHGVAVLKGHDTLVATQTGELFSNPTGNPGMATAGSGDVLTGIILSLAGQGRSMIEAAKGGVYLHGLAGDLAAGELGEYSLMAGDICTALPQAILSL
jgi:NAD(P)H-hydrate epimerase